MSNNLQKIPVKISWHSDVWSTSYSDLSDASLDILKTMDSKQFCVLIYHWFLMKKNTVQAQQWLEKCYGDSVPSKTTICRWYAGFKRGRTDTEDAERSGWPNEVVTPETIKKAHQIVFENRKLKLREIADILKISYGSVYAILHEHLSMRKLLWKWVPRLLTVDQKRQRVVDPERCLELFRRNKPNFLRRYVTMDETWIHHYTPKSKRSSAEWTAVGEKRPKRPKTQMWAGKVMASVFWDAHEVLFMEYLDKSKTINSEHYIG